jgi:pyruvate kinase
VIGRDDDLRRQVAATRSPGGAYTDASERVLAPYPRCSVVATVGPKTPIEACVEAGMRVMRLNCSHGNEAFYCEKVDRLRSYLRDRQGGRVATDGGIAMGVCVDCAVALDTKGPEIRTGMLYKAPLPGVLTVSTGDLLAFSADQRFELDGGQKLPLPRDCGVAGEAAIVYCDYSALAATLLPGMTLFVDDGLLRFEVVVIADDKTVVCRALNSGEMGERKGVNLPGAIVTLPAVSEKDREDIALGARLKVDYIFASFVRKAADVKAVRKILVEHGSPKTMIIAKIESQEGLDNFEGILEASNGIMVARGDMGIEIPPWKVVTAQKRIISLCNLAGKPVICATQMLESMINNPRPTRAEVSDVANAVLDGADCVMLSGETAKGAYPVEAITAMINTCREADRLVDYRAVFSALVAVPVRHRSVESVALASVGLAMDEGAALLICVTLTGNAMRYVSKYRPSCPVLAVTPDPQVARQCFLSRGVSPLLIDKSASTPTVSASDNEIAASVHSGTLRDDLIEEALAFAKSGHLVSAGDKVVAMVASTSRELASMRSFIVV